MDNRQIWITAFIALIVAIVVSLVTGVVSPALAPRTSLSSAPINANSCNADGICEINGANVEGQLNVFGLGKFDNGLNVNNGDTNIEGNLITLNDVELGKYGNVNPVMKIYQTSDGNKYLNVNDFAKFSGGLNVDSGDTSIEGPLFLITLSGNSTAYACLDNQGKLFRSQTPCV